MRQTLFELLSNGAEHAPALSAPGRAPLSYGALRHLIVATREQLNGLGLGRNDRVAIVVEKDGTKKRRLKKTGELLD